MNGVAYGSLYMDTGEKFELAKTQIDDVSKQKPIRWFFDVIIKENQENEGKYMVDLIFQYIESLGYKAEVALSVGDTARPAQKRMFDFTNFTNSD